MKRRNWMVGASSMLLAPASAWPVTRKGRTPTSQLARSADVQVLRFGQSASLSGSHARYGHDVRDGVLAALSAASHEDAARGLRYELVTLDDAGDAVRTRENARALIGSNVVSLLGFTSGGASELMSALPEEAGVAMLGVASGNMGIRAKHLRNHFHVRAGNDVEFDHLIRYIRDFGMKRVGYAGLADTTAANEHAMSNALRRVGVELTEAVRFDRNMKSYFDGAQRLLDAKLDCIVSTCNASTIAGFINEMAPRDWRGMYFASSFAGQELMDDMARCQRTVIVSQVVPRPNAVWIPVVARATRDLQAYAPGSRLNFTSLEGYIAGRVAVEAARRAVVQENPPTRRQYLEALANLSVDIGGYGVDFLRNGFDGSRFVDVVGINRWGQLIG